MSRISIAVIVALFCCASAFGQTPPNTTNAAARPGYTTRERPAPAAAPPVSAADANSPSAVMGRNGGSLLRASLSAAPADPSRAGIRSVSVFAVSEPEPKTVKKHDLITIIIREESEVSSAGTSDLKRQSDINGTLTQLPQFSLSNFALKSGIGAVPPSVQASGSRNFKGEATVDRTDSVVTRVTAEVLDVKPNGTLVLQARKRIKNDEEEQTLVCAGICRVEDLTPDNTVLSTQLFDLEFSKTNKGQVRNTTKTGMVHKLLDFINPF